MLSNSRFVRGHKQSPAGGVQFLRGGVAWLDLH